MFTLHPSPDLYRVSLHRCSLENHTSCLLTNSEVFSLHPFICITVSETIECYIKTLYFESLVLS